MSAAAIKPAEVAARIVAMGDRGAISASVQEIVALAAGFEFLVDQLQEVADAAALIRDLQEELPESYQSAGIAAHLDTIETAIFGEPQPTEEPQPQQETIPHE